MNMTAIILLLPKFFLSILHSGIITATSHDLHLGIFILLDFRMSAEL
jgi:hypothetical protein